MCHTVEVINQLKMRDKLLVVNLFTVLNIVLLHTTYRDIKTVGILHNPHYCVLLTRQGNDDVRRLHN